MKFTTRELVLMAVFGALWGASEISLGAVMHSLNIPMSGMILGGIGLCIAMIGRVFVSRKGSTLFIGVVAMIMKLFSIGSVVIGPMIGIFMEAMLAEVMLTAWRKTSRLSFMLAGIAGILWTLIQPFFTGLLLFGRNLVDIWLGIIKEGTSLFGLESVEGGILMLVLAFLILSRVVVGILAGWIAWDVGKLIQERLV